MRRRIHSDLLLMEIKRMLTNNELEAKVADIFKLINQNRADYQIGIDVSQKHAKQLVDELYERLTSQLKVRFTELESRLKTLESQRSTP